MKETKHINRFSEKDSHLGKWAILGPKTVNNLDPLLEEYF